MKKTRSYHACGIVRRKNTMEDHCLSLQVQLKMEMEPQTVNFMTTQTLIVNGDSVVSLNGLFLVSNYTGAI